MLERKLYMAGLGGNRYEISIENLKKMAYDAKIKKTDLVIVVETSDDGSAQEKTFRGKGAKRAGEKPTSRRTFEGTRITLSAKGG